MPRPLIVNSHIVIPSVELVTSFARSSGPGGQNVNKVNSKAVLRWNLRSSSSLPVDAKLRFESRFATRITQAGEVVLSSDKYRDQARNLADCYEKLRQLLQAALAVPRKRTKTRPTRGSVEGRLTNKRHTALRKQQRKSGFSEES